MPPIILSRYLLSFVTLTTLSVSPLNTPTVRSGDMPQLNGNYGNGSLELELKQFSNFPFFPLLCPLLSVSSCLLLSFQIIFPLSSSLHPTSSPPLPHRDALLCSILDGVRASGNRDICVKMQRTDRGQRLGPLNLPVEEEVESQYLKYISNTPPGTKTIPVPSVSFQSQVSHSSPKCLIPSYTKHLIPISRVSF